MSGRKYSFGAVELMFFRLLAYSRREVCVYVGTNRVDRVIYSIPMAEILALAP